MAEDTGTLTQDDKTKVAKFLTERGSTKPCPMCGHENFLIGDHMVVDNGFMKDGSFAVGGNAFPMVVLFCKNCAFVRMHSAIAVGLFANPEEAKNGK